MPRFVHRTLECAFGHRWRALAQVGEPPPGDCPICEAIVQYAEIPPARSDVVGAPVIRSERAKAIQRFEHDTMVKPHFEDGKPLLTNLRDNTRPGEVAAMPETPANNVVAKIVHEERQRAAATNQPSGPWGWQDPGGLGGYIGSTSGADRAAALSPLGKQT